MLHAVVAARFKDIDESDEAAVHVGAGVGERIANARLSRQIHHPPGTHFTEQRGQGHRIRNINLHKPKKGSSFELP